MHNGPSSLMAMPQELADAMHCKHVVHSSSKAVLSYVLENFKRPPGRGPARRREGSGECCVHKAAPYIRMRGLLKGRSKGLRIYSRAQDDEVRFTAQGTGYYLVCACFKYAVKSKLQIYRSVRA